MEVHHHAHTARKKWTHYFWEFLMLFLAVFCGFLAEYQLEHTIEHQRAKVYAKNLYEDLKKDTARILEIKKSAEYICKKLDTLCMFATEKTQKRVTNAMLYYYAQYTPYISIFSPNNATIEELKGSGNLRLLKSNVSQAISIYDKKLNELSNEYSLTKTEFAKLEELYIRIFDIYLSDKMSFEFETYPKDSILKLNPPLNDADQKLMKEYISWVTFEKSIYRSQVNDYLIPLKQEAVKLISLMKKEYHLD